MQLVVPRKIEKFTVFFSFLETLWRPKVFSFFCCCRFIYLFIFFDRTWLLGVLIAVTLLQRVQWLLRPPAGTGKLFPQLAEGHGLWSCLSYEEIGQKVQKDLNRTQNNVQNSWKFLLTTKILYICISNYIMYIDVWTSQHGRFIYYSISRKIKSQRKEHQNTPWSERLSRWGF